MTRRTRSQWQTLLPLVVVVSIVFAPHRGYAIDRWEAPIPGVRHLHRVANGSDYHVVVVDLTNPEVSLIATRPNDRFITTSEFARRYDAQIAINANFFAQGSCGLMSGDGEIFDRAYEENCHASIGFGRDNEAAIFDSALIPRGPVPAAWMTEVLSGKPFILRDGRALVNWVRPQHFYRPNPRTAIGLSADRRTLVIIAADGRRRGVPGLNGFQLVNVFREFNVSDAVNLDGGGSTALVMNGRLANQPSDGSERIVVSHLGIRARGGDVWQAAEILGGGSAANVNEGESATIWLEARNLGRSTWHADRDDGAPSPTFEIDDGVVGYVASVAHSTPPGGVGRFAIQWLARGAGSRRLHGRLVAPDGALLGRSDLAWELTVHRDPRVPPLEPQRVMAIARANQAIVPAGFGAVFVGTHGCAVRPGQPLRHALVQLGALSIAITVRTRRRPMR